jgi:hypothetical protein
LAKLILLMRSSGKCHLTKTSWWEFYSLKKRS